MTATGNPRSLPVKEKPWQSLSDMKKRLGGSGWPGGLVSCLKWGKDTGNHASTWVCAQSCPTLPNPIDCSPPGSSVHGISQARILEGVAISYSSGSSQPRDQTCISRVCCTGRQILLPLSHLGRPRQPLTGHSHSLSTWALGLSW